MRRCFSDRSFKLFLQFKLEEGCDIFAFDATNCGLGLLKYNVLPQGLSISSSVAQRALDELFEDLEHEQYAGGTSISTTSYFSHLIQTATSRRRSNATIN